MSDVLFQVPLQPQVRYSIVAPATLVAAIIDTFIKSALPPKYFNIMQAKDLIVALEGAFE